MQEPFLIRDFFSPRIVQKIATNIKSQLDSFDQEGFLKAILPSLETQTYSERKENIINGLIFFLPKDYATSVKILLNILPPPYEKGLESDSVDRFYVSTFTGYISKLGLDHYDLSLRALYSMTKCFTAEWDIRPFILKYPDKTFTLLKKWAKDENQHVRRLVSEGSRPNLPWGKKLKFIDENPEHTTLPILDLLQNDPKEYVRRSVANHLNDLAKNNPDSVVSRLTKWSETDYNKDKERMIHHALRTLIKRGHAEALSLIGYTSDFDIDVHMHTFTKAVPWSGQLDFSFTIINNKKSKQKLLIDYVIGYQKKDGKIADKVFKLKKIELEANSNIKINKKQSFKPITTRVYYPGTHKLSLQINGKIVLTKVFELLKP